jgi:hypothetical protein
MARMSAARAVDGAQSAAAVSSIATTRFMFRAFRAVAVERAQSSSPEAPTAAHDQRVMNTLENWGERRRRWQNSSTAARAHHA